MMISSGTRLGHYEILSRIGAGGMGEVWRAKDARLNREVAIKVLPASLASDADRLRRFEQEALATSALNHPNILTIYDIGTYEGGPYIVSELLDGEDLRAALKDGGFPARSAIDYAQQITRGLAAAHEKGIVHRDLKPENLFLTKDGRIKILDFGLAKLTQSKSGRVETQAPTTPLPTESGVVMGTVGYMSPEQVRGQDADHRVDIFSFGVILYEMLNGKRAFQGESSVEVMNAILKDDPMQVSGSNSSISPGLEKIVSRCLEKKPGPRFHSAHDLGLAIEAVAASSALTSSGAAVSLPAPEETEQKRAWWPRTVRERLGWVITGTLLLALLAALPFAVAYFRRPAAVDDVVRLVVLPPERTTFSVGPAAAASMPQPTLSPDGRLLAFVSVGEDSKQILWVRPLASVEVRMLVGTEDASYPFWSPDSRFIGFFAGSKLKKIDAQGKSVQVLCDALHPRGGSWNADGLILFSPHYDDVLFSVSAAGGPPTPVTSLNSARQEYSHQWPYFLPDGRHFLYHVRSSQKENGGIFVGSLDSKSTQRLHGADSNAAYAPAGYLLFRREDRSLVAQPFDSRSLQLSGEPIPVVEQVRYDLLREHAAFSVSQNNVLAFASSRPNAELLWFNREGKRLGSVGDPGLYLVPSLSPDEKRLAVAYRRAMNTEARIESIAVMPFVNASNNADFEYLSVGMTETLIGSLSQLPNLNVKPRASVFRYKGKETSPQDIGKELNVQAILNGRVVQRGHDLSLFVELIDVALDKVVWSQQYNRKQSDIVILQTEIARDVSSRLKTKLSGADEANVTKTYTANPEAYQLYLKGNYYKSKYSEEGYKKAIDYFQRAIEKDPNYALAYSEIAAAYNFASDWYLPPHEAMPKAKAAALKALELDSTLAGAHSNLGIIAFWYEWDWKTSERELLRSMELDPTYSHKEYGLYLTAMGRLEEAIRQDEIAQAYSPLDLLIYFDFAQLYTYAGRYDEAIEKARKAIELDENYWGSHVTLGLAYERKRQFPEAIAEMEKAHSLDRNNAWITGYLGYVYAAAGKKAEAQKFLDELIELSKQRWASPFNIAIIYGGLNNKDQAFEWLNKSFEARSLLPLLRVEIAFENLRTDQRFKDLLRRLNLPE